MARGRAVLEAGPIYAPGPVHAVRIRLKKFRYVFELANQLGKSRHGTTLGRLKGWQDTLGDMHDLQVLAGHVRDASASAPNRGRAGLSRLADDLDDAIRALHSRYLADRGEFDVAIARAARLSEMLAAGAPAAADGRPAPARSGRG
jgi:CHAD domain-containing protein